MRRPLVVAVFFGMGVLLLGSPAFAQTPDSSSAPRMRMVPRFRYRIPDVRLDMHRLPPINRDEIRSRAYAGALRARRELAQRGTDMRFRLEMRNRALEDRSWQRRMDVERRAMERVRDQIGRMKIREPMFRRRHFRVI